MPPAPSAALRALVAFHWHAGTRASLRATIILGCVIVFVLGSAPNALHTLMLSVRGVVGLGSPPVGRVMLAAICVAFAAVAAPRVRVGTAGWLRSLPASGATARRAATVGLSLAQIPVLVAVAGAYVAAPLAYHATPPASRLAALPALVVAAAATALPVTGIGGRVAALAALAASVVGTWPAVAASVALLALADAASGTIAPPPAVRRPRAARPVESPTEAPRAATAPWRGRVAALRLAAALALRALGVARPLSEVLPALLPLGVARLVLANNPDLSPAGAHGVARACAGIAVALAAAGVANALLARRAPWPWPRSLPWSAAERVAADAGALALWCLPIVGAAATLGWRGVAAAATVTPLAAAIGAAALRTGAGRHTGAAGEVVGVAIPCAVIAALWPRLAPAALALAPLALAIGARRERDGAAARWTELRHGVAGDPAWISGR